MFASTGLLEALRSMGLYHLSVLAHLNQLCPVCCLQFIDRIKTAYPNNNVAVNINSINAGSVVVNQTTSFLDGDQAAASMAASDMATAPSRIFPASTYGNVTTSGISNGTAANPAGRLQARLESCCCKA